jgi:hypothetical protein
VSTFLASTALATVQPFALFNSVAVARAPQRVAKFIADRTTQPLSQTMEMSYCYLTSSLGVGTH